jgi:hypothetical protein
MTGDGWNDTMSAMFKQREDMKVLIVAYFVINIIIQHMIIVNLFVMVQLIED